MKKITTINDLRIAANNLDELKKLSRKLNKMFTADCNFGETPARESREEKTITKIKEIAESMGLFHYIQTDPRGASVYLLEKKEEANRRYYDRGIALY